MGSTLDLGWFWFLMLAGLATFLLAVTVVPWPRRGSFAERWWPLGVAAVAVAGVAIGWMSLTYEAWLPHIAAEGAPSPSDPIAVYALLVAFVTGAILSARRYRQTVDPIVGYVALTQLVLAFVTVNAVISLRLYDTWWYWQRALWLAAFWLMLFGLLSEHARLYRRELETVGELRQFEHRLSLLWQRTPLGAIEWDTDWRVVRWNPAAERIFGYVEAEAIGRHASFILPPDASESVGAVMSSLLADVGGERHANENVTKDGRIILCDWYNAPLKAPDGQVSGVISLVDDITERRRGEEALRESEERLRLAQQVAHVGAFELNLKTGVNHWTPELEALYGLPAGGFPGTRAAWEQLVHPEDRPKSIQLIERALQAEEPVEGEWRVVWPDGSVRWLTGRFQAFQDESGQPSRLIGVNIDNTERRMAIEGLREERNLNAALLDTVATLVVVLDSAGRIVRFNRTCEVTTGYAAAEVLGRAIWEFLLLPEETAGVRSVFERMRAGDFPLHYENYWLTKQGERRLISWANTVLLDDRGRVQYVIGTGSDVTESRRAEQSLRDSEERFRVIFEQAAVGIGQVAIGDGRFLRVNQRLCDIVGYSAEELTQTTFVNLTHPDDREQSADLARRLFDGAIPAYSVEKRYVRRDGSPVWVNVTTSLVRGVAGEPQYYIGIVEDIGRRKTAEQERERLLVEQVDARRRIEELAETAQRHAAELQAVLDNMVEGVFVASPAGQVVLVNQSFARFLGLTDPADAHRPLADLATWLQLRHPDGSPIRMSEMTSARALTGQTVVNEDQILINQRTRRDVYVRANAAPIRDELGAITGSVTVLRDVTELTELDRLKDQFVEVAAHELKTPVTIMKGYAQTLLRTGGDLAEPRRRMLDAISRGADRIDGIILDLLDISQLTLGRLAMARERVDLSQLIEETVDRMALTAPKHRLRVTQAVPVTVQGDRQRLEQVLVNLLDNAVRYSPGGGKVDVAMSVRADEVVISVKDEGAGIPKEKQGQIFQRFYRAHTGTPYDYGGMGVGLYISAEIVNRHGGQMWFESEEGKGSAFYFSLPLTKE